MAKLTLTVVFEGPTEVLNKILDYYNPKIYGQTPFLLKSIIAKVPTDELGNFENKLIFDKEVNAN